MYNKYQNVDVKFKQYREGYDEFMGKSIKQWFSEIDRYSFRNHLTMKENAQFDHDESLIANQHDELIRKYNKIASDRISRSVIIRALQKPLQHNFIEVSRILEEIPNETLQLILNVLNISNKEKEEQKKENNV